jgi:PAS domain S-box-containing protein
MGVDHEAQLTGEMAGRARSENSDQELILRVFRDASIGLVITDQRGRFVIANEAFSRMTGYSPQELPGLEFATITHPEDRRQNVQLKEDMRSGKVTTSVFEKRYLHKDGRTV